MTDRDRVRLRAARCVSMLMRDRDFANVLTVTDDSGCKPIVTVLEQDSVHFAARCARSLGGRANLVVFERADDGGLQLVIGRLYTEISTGDGDWNLPVGPASTVGDLFRMLTPGASVTFRLAEDEIEIVNLLNTPAPAKAVQVVGL